MQVVCEATQSLDTQVRVAALQCLVKIMSLYYQFMEHYMGPALFAVRLFSCFSAKIILHLFSLIFTVTLILHASERMDVLGHTT